MTFLIAANRRHDDVATANEMLAQKAADVAPQQAAVAPISVDQLAAVDAVTSLAEASDLPIAGDLRETATTLEVKKQLAQADTEVIAKPQAIQTETSAKRGMVEHIVKQGEDIAKIAAQYGISAQTLRWANGMTTDAVEPGKKIVVPRTNGVVYTVKEGDTLASVASKYKADAERIALHNDIEANAPLTAGVRLVLPDAELPEAERPGYVAPRPAPVYGRSYGRSFINSSYARASVGNRYAGGNCTWYSYERRAALGRPIGSFWGNANTWAASARAAGFTVNRTPAPGAIFQTAAGGGGYGHVGIVERVENGRVFVSDMNYAGYGVVTHRELSNPGAYNYIH